LHDKKLGESEAQETKIVGRLPSPTKGNEDNEGFSGFGRTESLFPWLSSSFESILSDSHWARVAPWTE
jgi:hypothetical protein